MVDLSKMASRLEKVSCGPFSGNRSESLLAFFHFYDVDCFLEIRLPGPFPFFSR